MILTVAITAHDEGLMLHKTLCSIKNAVSFLNEKDYEILIHIDNGDKKTIEYKNNKAIPIKVRFFENHFGDLGSSRNFCTDKAKGKYIFFIDADDLISANFIEVALKRLEDSDEDLLLHPEACVSFEQAGGMRSLWIMKEGRNKDETVFSLFERNQWISSIIGKREIFKKYPYPKTEKGYGHEDYALNINTIADGIIHGIAGKTVHFYRQKRQSLLRISNSNLVTQRYSKLFDFERWRYMKVSEEPEKKRPNLRTKAKVRAKEIYKSLRNRKIPNMLIEPFANIAKELTGLKLIKTKALPRFVINELKNISNIETQLYPSEEAIDSFIYYDSGINNHASAAYYELSKNISCQPDYVFVVPWVIAGGADKVLINYIKALKENYPGKNVAIITTLPSKNPWSKKLPDNAFLIDFGKHRADLDQHEEEILFTRLLVQLAPRRIHVINSEFMYRWLDTHRLLAKNFKVDVSLFCYDIIPATGGQGRFDYADPFAVDAVDLIDKIYTDNTATVDRLVSLHGFDKTKIKVLFQPSGYDLQAHKVRKAKKLRVLWASRICTQKNPELLAKIARCLDEQKIENISLHAYGKADSEYENSPLFKNLRCLKYHGEFNNGLESIEVDNYDALLYTTHIDGMPNIILEATALGLPIIASDAGGIKDVIKDKKGGFLVSPADDVGRYIDALIALRDDWKLRENFARNAQTILAKKYNWKRFSAEIKNSFEIK